MGTPLTNSTRPALEFCKDRIHHFESKADHNKRESLSLFVSLIFCTLAAPLFITLGQSAILAKIVPSVLSSVATGCAVWLQQRRPQQLWLLYRTMQRQLEGEANGFEFFINDYQSSPDPEKLLAERTVAICMNAHQLWAPLVPNPEGITGSLNPDHSQLKGHSTK